MKVTIKKLPVSDVATMQTLIIEHADSIEAGLTVLDSRLLLGEATIDVVGCDANAALVLMAIGGTADEDLLLKAVEAYSWCLEYPDAVRRLYPSIDISTERPPRIVFVVERVPDAFHRKIKQLGFSEVDCIEARYLDVDGTPAVYFDVVARLRRGVPPAPAVVPAAAVSTTLLPAARAEAPISAPTAERQSIAENVIPLNGGTRATSVKLQRLLNAGLDPGALRPDHPVARAVSTRAETPATVIRMPTRTIAEPAVLSLGAPAPSVGSPVHVVVPDAEIETSEPSVGGEPAGAGIADPVVAAMAELAAVARALPRIDAAPRIEPQRPSPATPAAGTPVEPGSRVSFANIAQELLGGPAAEAPRAERTDSETAANPLADDARAAIDELLALAPPVVTPPAPAVIDAPKADTPTVVAKETPGFVPRGPVSASKPAVEPKISIKPAAPAATAPAETPTLPTPPAWAKAPVRKFSAAAAPKAAPAEAKPAGGTPATPERKAPVKLPAEFADLRFPNDGQLTRQWMEFLNQMSASK